MRLPCWTRLALSLTLAVVPAACGDDDDGGSDAGPDGSPDAALDGGTDGGADTGPPPPRDAGPRPGLDGSFPPRPDADVAHPMDDVLRLHHLQAEGTHNSYHLDSENSFPGGDYTMPTLTEQLDVHGVRKLELDIHWEATHQRWHVYHAGIVDDRSSCDLLLECLAEVRRWSDAHPGHHPIFLQIEPKTPFREADIDAQQAELDDNVREVFGEDLVVTPDLVRGTYATVREAVTTTGWPTLGEVRGRVLLFLDCSREWALRYAHGGTDLDGRMAFPDSQPTDDFAAFRVMNSPDDPAIPEAVAQGFLVRTRALGLDEARAGDDSRWPIALASGAHMISTDAPGPRDDILVHAEIPGGTPSRCNPVSAPDGCTSLDIEDPSRIAP